MHSFGGNSRQSISALRERLSSGLSGLGTSQCQSFGDELFAVYSALASTGGLRRALTDPSRDHEAKALLVSNILTGKVSQGVVEVVAAASALRWSAPADIVRAIEQLAVESYATAANHDGQLDQLEEELFAFGKLLIVHNELRQVLNSSEHAASGKVALLQSVLSGKVNSFTLALLAQLLTGLHRRSIENALAGYTDAIAARRNRLRATAKSAVALSDAQKSKLADALSAKLGQPVHVNVEIDPSVIGGLSIRFGHELIDGSVKNRLEEAARALTA
jgi:F-type H+-transporting ATPase subunit delta